MRYDEIIGPRTGPSRQEPQNLPLPANTEHRPDPQPTDAAACYLAAKARAGRHLHKHLNIAEAVASN